MEKTIYLVRHGESVDNTRLVHQSPDSPLSEKGREQARLIAERIAKVPFDALIASPLLRTRETADEITKSTGKEAEYSDLFMERIKPSRLNNGKPFDDPEVRELSEIWRESLTTSGMKAEDGENFDEIIARADKALTFLSERSEQALVVVTHGFFLRTMLSRILLGSTLQAENFRHFQTHARTQNTGLSVIKLIQKKEQIPAWRLWIFNDHAHLG